MLDIKYEKYVDKLIDILIESKETLEKEIFNEKWIKDIGVCLMESLIS